MQLRIKLLGQMHTPVALKLNHFLIRSWFNLSATTDSIPYIYYHVHKSPLRALDLTHFCCCCLIDVDGVWLPSRIHNVTFKFRGNKHLDSLITINCELNGLCAQQQQQQQNQSLFYLATKEEKNHQHWIVCAYIAFYCLRLSFIMRV